MVSLFSREKIVVSDVSRILPVSVSARIAATDSQTYLWLVYLTIFHNIGYKTGTEHISYMIAQPNVWNGNLYQFLANQHLVKYFLSLKIFEQLQVTKGAGVAVQA